MKAKYILLIMLQLFFCNVLLAQRYNISPEAGQKGLLIAGAIFFIVMIITVVLHLRDKSNKH